MKILITGGGSEEPIDNVRYISNFSSGRTAAFFADYFSKKGHTVTLLTSIKAIKPLTEINTITYRTFNDLKSALEKECKSLSYDGVIHAAAVSDYSVASIIVDGNEYPAGSIPKVSGGQELTIKMKKNPKLVDFIKSWAKDIKLVAFKLTSQADSEERKKAVKKVFDSTQSSLLCPDYVVSNDLSEITEEKHPCVIYSKEMKAERKTENLEELSRAMEELLEG
ncbi:MAG: hypothetical protein K6E78_00145 [Treponema sp.]|nr:hypothetical protein [Treponema sp.]